MKSNRFVCEFMCEVFLEIKKLPTLEFSKKNNFISKLSVHINKFNPPKFLFRGTNIFPFSLNRYGDVVFNLQVIMASPSHRAFFIEIENDSSMQRNTH